MVPPGDPSTGSRRVDTDKTLRQPVEPASLGPSPAYRQGSISVNSLSSFPPSSGSSTTYRGDRASQYEGTTGIDQGQNSPQPSNADRDAEGENKFKDLLVKYKHVKQLFFDGKSQIEQLTGQVERLQNAVANQRMSQSRTAWDDNEYTTHFNRLNGAIQNLSFNIRKDWRSLPPWLDGFVSADALKTGKQEMTAVGRAVVSRWMVDEMFNKCFHPGLDPRLSADLKEVELRIRGNTFAMHSQEELDTLTAKVVNWRMATLDGLQWKLSSSVTSKNKTALTARTAKGLTTHLYQHLSNPPPPGVEGSATMIAELAVAIATNLPMESRDVTIAYPLPGDVVQTNLMDVEKPAFPTLDSHRAEGETIAVGVTDQDDDDDEDDNDLEDASRDRARGTRARRDRTKTSHGSQVRFAGFMALEVRGRQVLIKAPVWTC